MDYSYVSIDRIFARLGSLANGVPESDIIEWTGEALEHIGAVKSYSQVVAFVEVSNHQCDLPKGLHGIIQIARNNGWFPLSKKNFCPSTIQAALTTTDTDCKINTVGTDPCVCPPTDAVWLDCNGKPIVAYDLAYYRPYFDITMDYGKWIGNNFYTKAFTPVRLSTNSMFSGLLCKTGGHSPYESCKDEYSIIEGKALRFSFKTGAIALAYLKQVVDTETGYPMIPDNISYTTAITKYVLMRKFEMEFYAGRDGAKAKLDKAEGDWHWYCGQASNNEKIPHGLDEHQNMLESRSRLLPDNEAYYGFFGNLNNPEYGRTIPGRRHIIGDRGEDLIINSTNTTVVDDKWDVEQW